MKAESDITRYEVYIPQDELLRDYYSFDVTFRKCSECDSFGKTWACPPFDFGPKEFLGRFSGLRMIVDRIDNSFAKDVGEAQDRLMTEKRRFDREMRDLEKENPGSYALAAQECTECSTCQRQLGRPCIHPEIVRYGPESLGLYAVKLVKDKLGFDILWSDGRSIPEYYLLVAGILVK